MNLLFAGIDSEPHRVAGVIMQSAMIGEHIELQAIAAEAKCCALSALIAANIELARKGVQVSCIPSSPRVGEEGRKMAARFSLIAHELQPDQPAWQRDGHGWPLSPVCRTS